MAKSIENARIFLNLFTRNLSFAFLLNPKTKKNTKDYAFCYCIIKKGIIQIGYISRVLQTLMTLSIIDTFLETLDTCIKLRTK